MQNNWILVPGEWHNCTIKPNGLLYRQENTMNIWYKCIPRKNSANVSSHLLKRAPLVSTWISLKKATCDPQSFLWCFYSLAWLYLAVHKSSLVEIIYISNLLGYFSFPKAYLSWCFSPDSIMLITRQQLAHKNRCDQDEYLGIKHSSITNRRILGSDMNQFFFFIILKKNQC